uniref:Uncharacterized protein n=1 Tax=Trichogramma kaykai TaxID=54128 RepID=A0ABD2W819_9HYME
MMNGESGIDISFDLNALTRLGSEDDSLGLEYSCDLEQTLAAASTQDFMYYELKSRAPDTGRASYSNLLAEAFQYSKRITITFM